jgi:hypothetical protein
VRLARVGALLLACAVAAPSAVAAAQAARREPFPVDELMEAQVFALLTMPPAEGAPDREALCAELAALGAGLAPIAAGILCGEIAVPESVPDSEPELPVDPRLVELRDGVLRQALARLDQGVVVDHLARRASGDAPLEVRLCAARLLGESRHPRAVDVLLQVAAGIEPIHLSRSYVLQSFEQPLAEALAVDPRADAALSGRMARLDPAVRDVLLRAAVQADSAATRRFLASRLTASAAEQGIVLGAIAAGRPGAFEASPEQLEALRARLSAPDDGLARLAAMALGKLEDRDALEELIELLSSEDALEVKAAHEALRGISGSDLGAQPAAWRAWLAAEEAWWEEQAPVELQRLASGERKLVHRALQELQRHPLYRHESAPQVAQLLQEEDDLLVLAGCDALGALGSREALPALIDALALSEGALRAAVLRALQPLARRDPELRAFLAANAAASLD